MIMHLYMIRDKVAEEFGPVFEAKNDGVAARKFRDMMSQQAFKGSSEDFEVYEFGQVDHENGKVKVYELKVLDFSSTPTILQMKPQGGK